MTTSQEFIKAGITGQTFREIREKFGRPLKELGAEDAIMSTYALGFAWFREREHLPVQSAYDKAMGYSIEAIEDLFEDDSDPQIQTAVDFASQPPTTKP